MDHKLAVRGPVCVFCDVGDVRSHHMQSWRRCVDLDVLQRICPDLSAAWMSYPKHGPQDVRAYRAKRRFAFGVMSVVDPFDMFLFIITSTGLCPASLLCCHGGFFSCCLTGSTDEWVKRARERARDLLARRRQEREKVSSLEGSEDAPEPLFCTATLPGGGVVLRARSTERSGKLDGDELGDPAVDRTSAGSNSREKFKVAQGNIVFGRLYAIVSAFFERICDCRSRTEELHNLCGAQQALHTWDNATHDPCTFTFLLDIFAFFRWFFLEGCAKTLQQRNENPPGQKYHKKPPRAP